LILILLISALALLFATAGLSVRSETKAGTRMAMCKIGPALN